MAEEVVVPVPKPEQVKPVVETTIKNKEVKKAPSEKKEKIKKAVEKAVVNPDRAHDVLRAIVDSLSVGKEKFLHMKISFNRTETIDELKKSNDPENRALGFDLEIAFLRYDMAIQDEKGGAAVKKGKMTAEDLKKNQTETDKRVLQIEDERKKIVDEKKQPYPNRLSELMSQFVEQDNQPEQKMAAENPLKLFESKVNEAIHDPKKREAFLNKIASIEADAPETAKGSTEILFQTITGALKMEQEKAKKLKNGALLVGGLPGLLMLLSLWSASKDKQGGALLGG